MIKNEPEIADLTRSIAPLTELSATLELIFLGHENHVDLPYIDYKAKNILISIERLMGCIRLVR